MKIKQYQEVYQLLSSTMPELEKACAFYSIMKGVKYEDVETNVPIKKVLDYFKKWGGIKPSAIYSWYRIGWRFYKLDLAFSEYTASDVIALRSYFASEQEVVNNLHKVMALLTKRKNKSIDYFNELSQNIQTNMGVSKAYSVSVFFCENYNREAILMRLDKSLQRIVNDLRKKQQSKLHPLTSKLLTAWHKATGQIGSSI